MKPLFAIFAIFAILVIHTALSCSTINCIEEDDYIIIQLNEVNSQVETYYAEITLVSGSRIAVELGQPDEYGKFRVKNNFGRFTDIELYTDLDLESDLKRD